MNMNQRKVLFFALAFATAVIGSPAFAQGGCVNSPENPTAVLALAGFSAAAVSVLRSKYAARKNRSAKGE